MSYQVMCSVTRPQNPVSLCHVAQLQDKVQCHLDAVLQDVPVTCEGGGGGSSSRGGEGGGPSVDTGQVSEDNQMVCAVVSKTSALFSGRSDV